MHIRKVWPDLLFWSSVIEGIASGPKLLMYRSPFLLDLNGGPEAAVESL